MKKILVIRFSALGDIAMTVPVVHDLAVQHPDCEITLLSRSAAKPLFEHLPDNVLFFAADLEGRHRGLAGLNRLLQDIHFKDFDYIADLHDVLRTKWLRLIFRLSGKPVAKIDKGRRGKRRLTRAKNKLLVPQASSFERYANVLERLGFPTHPTFVRLDHLEYGEQQKQPGETWIGIAPFAKHPAKVYPTALMEQVIKQLHEKVNVTLFLFCGPEEKALTEGLCTRHPYLQAVHSPQGLAGELALMSQLDVMLSMDSANMHFASLVGTPVVSVWGGTHPYAGFLGWNQRLENCVQLDIPCRPCSVFGNKPCRRGDYICMQDITPERILEKLKPFLS